MLDDRSVGLSGSQCVLYVANDFILVLCVISCIISQVPKYSEPLPVFSFSKVCITACGGWFILNLYCGYANMFTTSSLCEM